MKTKIPMTRSQFNQIVKDIQNHDIQQIFHREIRVGEHISPTALIVATCQYHAANQMVKIQIISCTGFSVEWFGNNKEVEWILASLLLSFFGKKTNSFFPLNDAEFEPEV